MGPAPLRHKRVKVGKWCKNGGWVESGALVREMGKMKVREKGTFPDPWEKGNRWSGC